MRSVTFSTDECEENADYGGERKQIEERTADRLSAGWDQTRLPVDHPQRQQTHRQGSTCQRGRQREIEKRDDDERSAHHANGARVLQVLTGHVYRAGER